MATAFPGSVQEPCSIVGPSPCCPCGRFPRRPSRWPLPPFPARPSHWPAPPVPTPPVTLARAPVSCAACRAGPRRRFLRRPSRWPTPPFPAPPVALARASVSCAAEALARASVSCAAEALARASVSCAARRVAAFDILHRPPASRDRLRSFVVSSPHWERAAVAVGLPSRFPEPPVYTPASQMRASHVIAGKSTFHAKKRSTCLPEKNLSLTEIAAKNPGGVHALENRARSAPRTSTPPPGRRKKTRWEPLSRLLPAAHHVNLKGSINTRDRVA